MSKSLHVFVCGWVIACMGCGAAPNRAPCDPRAVGVLCTLAGTGESAYTGEEGPAYLASLSLPQDTITAPDGTIYLLDWNNHRIRSITQDGLIHLVAGRGELGGTLDDPASSDFNHPTGLLLDDEARFLYVAAWHNSMIRKIELSTGQISDTCGDGRRAYFGDNGPAKTAALDLPASIAWDPRGSLVIMDQANQVLREIDATGIIRHRAGQCIVNAAPAGAGRSCSSGLQPVACPAGSGKRTCGDPATTCSLPCTPGYEGDELTVSSLRIAQPFGQSADPGGRIVFDPHGNLYFADTSNALIRMIDTEGKVHRVAGVAPVDGKPQRGYSGEGGPAREALLNNPVDLALGDDGTLFFTDVYNHCVRAIGPDQNIHTVVGHCGEAGPLKDKLPVEQALLKRPYGLEWVNGTLLISDTGNHALRAVRLRAP